MCPVIAQLVERLTVVESCTGLSMASEIKWPPVRFRLTGLSFSHFHLLSFSYPLFSISLFLSTTLTRPNIQTHHIYLHIQQLHTIQSIPMPHTNNLRVFHQNISMHGPSLLCFIYFMRKTHTMHRKALQSRGITFADIHCRASIFVVHVRSSISDKKLPKVVA